MSSSKKSSELARAWLEFTRIQIERHSGELPLATPFCEMAWDRFDPLAVAHVLLDKRTSYFAHKEILFAAFSSWVVTSDDSLLWRDAVVLTALGEMARAEKLAIENHANVGWTADFVVRFEQIGPIFFDQIYYPIGGVAEFARAPSSEHLRDKIAGNKGPVKAIVELMKIFHHCIEQLVPIGRRRPSLNTAATIVKSIAQWENDGSGLKARMIKTHWSKRQAKSSLIYAASTMQMFHARSLLDGLLDGTATYQAYQPYLAEWFAKSRFVTEKILSGLIAPKASEDSRAVLLKGELKDISAPTYSPEAAREIREKFAPR